MTDDPVTQTQLDRIEVVLNTIMALLSAQLELSIQVRDDRARDRAYNAGLRLHDQHMGSGNE